MDLGHSVQLSFLCLSPDFQVVFCVQHIQCWVIAYQYPIVGSSKLLYNNLVLKGLASGFWVPLADNVLPKGKTCANSNTMWYDREYVLCHDIQIGVLWVCCLLFSPPVGNIQYPKCTPNLHWLRVVIIEIWIDLPTVLWWSRGWIQIEPGGSQ